MKITPDILSKMIEMRKKGATYKEIGDTLGVKKERCMTYLQNIKTEPSAMEVKWRGAEDEAPDILSRNGFSHIVNLNEICSVEPYWDYYAERGEEKWLIDVTVNGRKSISAKQEFCVDKYNHAIFLKDNAEWKFITITRNVDFTYPVLNREREEGV